MFFDGEWYLCDDGERRPVLRGAVLSADGTWVKELFLLDTGADRTVISGEVFARLGVTGHSFQRLGGIGGAVESAVIDTEIRLTRETGAGVTFRGSYAAFGDMGTLDMSVLGRDITGLFALLIDQQADRVCMAGHGHHCIVIE